MQRNLRKIAGASIPHEAMMHFPPVSEKFLWLSPTIFVFPPILQKSFVPPTLTNFPLISYNFRVLCMLPVIFVFSPTLTMKHLCMTQCMYWTPLEDCDSCHQNGACFTRRNLAWTLMELKNISQEISSSCFSHSAWMISHLGSLFHFYSHPENAVTETFKSMDQNFISQQYLWVRPYLFGTWNNNLSL